MKSFNIVCPIAASILFVCHASAIELIVCPKVVQADHVVLKSKEGECVQLRRSVAEQSRSLQSMIEDLGGDTSHIVPMEMMDSAQLKDIATLMDEAFGQPDTLIKNRLANIRKDNQYDLVKVIRASSYLDVARILEPALDEFSKKIFDEDLPSLSKRNASGYAIYKKAILQSLPEDLTRLMIQRNSALFLPPAQIAKLNLGGGVRAVAFSPDGEYILTGHKDGTAKLWSAKVRGNNAQPLVTFRDPDPVEAVAFSPDGKLILTGSGPEVEAPNERGAAKLWDASGRGNVVRPLATWEHESGVFSVAFSQNNKYILTGTVRGARLWSSSVSGTVAQPLAVFGSDLPARSVAFSPDGKFILTGSMGDVNLWDASVKGNGAQPLATFYGLFLRAVAFSPDGKLILTGQIDLARLWDANVRGKDFQPLTTFHVERNTMIHSVAFSPDGKYVLTGSRDVILWNAHERRNISTPLAILNHAEAVTSIAFSPDGNYIFTGSLDNTAKIWSLLDPNKVSLAAAQIILYARKNKLTTEMLSQHLRDELNDDSKVFVSGT